MKLTVTILIVFLGVFLFQPVKAQLKISHDQGLKYFLNEEKTDYVQFKFSTQFWFRYLETNPGSLVENEARSSVTDLSIRRLRIGADGILFNKLYYNISLGGNNFNYLVSNRNRFHLLNLEMKYQLHPAFAIGLGKTNFGTFSRYGGPATSQLLALDLPIYAFPTVNRLDDLGRNWSMFGTGTYKNFNYQFAFTQTIWSFQDKNVPKEPGDVFNFAYQPHRLKVSSYIKYQLFDRESCETPFSSGTHLGGGKYVTFGAGFQYQPEGMWRRRENGTTELHDLVMLSADLFVEIPSIKENGSAWSYYMAFFNYNLGDNYLRNIGINNPGSGNTDPSIINGSGNSYPAVGTGNDLFIQGGYLFGIKNREKSNPHRLQVYGLFNLGNFERLDENVLIYGSGLNYYLNRQRSKLSLGYRNRPVFKTTKDHENQVFTRKGEWVVQYQIVIK